MVINNTQTTLTITPAVGAPIVLTGAEALYKLMNIIHQPGAIYTYDRLTGVYTGSFSYGHCCASFATTQANTVITIVLDPILCVL